MHNRLAMTCAEGIETIFKSMTCARSTETSTLLKRCYFDCSRHSHHLHVQWENSQGEVDFQGDHNECTREDFSSAKAVF